MSLSFSEAIDRIVRRDGEEEGTPSCATGNAYDGNMGIRISSIFVIMVAASFGALFPVVAKNNTSLRIPSSVFFFTKYFGSGVIIATAFIHLLAPSAEVLSNPCLTGVITEYPWAQGIALISVFSLFFVELLAMRYATFSTMSPAIAREAALDTTRAVETTTSEKKPSGTTDPTSSLSSSTLDVTPHATSRTLENEPHLSHASEHGDLEKAGVEFSETYAAQLTSIFILEFGVVFHSVLIGLTLAVSGSEFKTLYIVLTFHQMFEGLGLGTRLAVIPWPSARWRTPYIMALAYGLSTPIAIAAGLGVRNSYHSEGATALVVAGVFDGLSAGILLYTGLVELMAHEFLFNRSLKEAEIGTLLSAFGCMVLGAFLMSLLGKWA